MAKNFVEEGKTVAIVAGANISSGEGNTNISGVTVVFRAGEQEQTPPEGFESSGSETVLGTEVKYDTPITRAITSAIRSAWRSSPSPTA
ncbi:hypothetical protein CE216_003081 [Escherichia coli]|nr:hypothetical protein [Escherichia coli]